MKTKVIIERLNKLLNNFEKSNCPDKLRSYEMNLTNEISFLIEELEQGGI